MEIKKVVFKLDIHDDKNKQKAMRTVSGVLGVESLSMDKDHKLTVIGVVDPIQIVKKLRKHCHTEIVTVGPAKEPEKKKEEPTKEEPKKADGGTQIANPYIHCSPYVHTYNHTPPYCQRIEEDPIGCIIC